MNRFISITDVADINPKVPKSLSKEGNSKVTFLPMSAVSEAGFIVEHKESSIDSVIKGYRYFEDGDVLLAKITPCMENGKAAFVEKLPHNIGFGSTEFHVFRPNSELDGRYLFYMVWNPFFRHVAARNMTGTAGQRRVPTDFVKRFKIPFPPLAEQKRIAAILDKADGVRRKRQEAIRLTEELLRARFLDMFGDPVTNPKGWDVVKLEDFCVIQSGIAKGKKLKGDEFVSLPYMRVANVQDGHIDLSKVKEITVSLADAQRFSLQKGDVLLTEGGDPDKLGRGAVWHGEINPCIHQNHIFCVRPDPNVARPNYLSAIIGSERGKRYFLRAAKQTTGIATINKTQLKSFPALIPKLELQTKYDQFLESFENHINQKVQYQKQSENLFNSLLQRAFRGEL